MPDQTTRDALEIAAMTGVDRLSITLSPIQAEVAISKMVTAHVVTRYTLTDQVLADTIFIYFFRIEPPSQRFESEWSTEAHRIFFHHILDETFLLKKLAIVHAIRPVPSDTTATIQKMNALRNAIAHSFIPESRKEYRASGKLLYANLDIRTPVGLKKFDSDMDNALDYLYARAYGPSLGTPEQGKS
jgi:hypothetical protein